MIEKLTSLLYIFDIIGTTPQLLIFNNKRYKSIFSSLISVLIIIFSMGFAIYSLYEYLKYQSPNISFSKDNDIKTERSFLLKDFILAFELIDAIDNYDYHRINDSIAYYQADFVIYYNDGSKDYKQLSTGKCEFGTNIDIKYKDLFNKGTSYGRNIEDFYCLNT